MAEPLPSRSDWLSRAASAMAGLGISILMVMALLSVLEILVRWLLRTSVIGISDVLLIGTVLGVCACFPYCSQARGHIAIDMLPIERWSPRARRVLEVCVAALTTVVLGAIAFQLWRYGVETGEANGATLMLHIPLGIVWQAASVLLGFATLIEMMNTLRRCGSGEATS